MPVVKCMTSCDAPIPWGRPNLTELEREYVAQAVDSGWVSGGEFVDRLERDFSVLHGVRYGMAVSSGTAALHLCLAALGVGPGDEVIVPGYSFAATWNAVLYCGATPRFCDVDPVSWLLDTEAAQRVLSPRTKAVIVVHLHGAMPDMDQVMSFARRAGIALVEDVAQAIGSTWNGQRAGSFGILSAFSFQATKTITTGEGGMVLTGDAELAARVRLLREHGLRQRGRYFHEAVGFNYRLTNLQAALGCAQLERLDGLIEARRAVDAAYRDVVVQKKLGAMQGLNSGVVASPFAFPLLVHGVNDEGGRDGLLTRICSMGVEVRPGWHSADRMPLYRTNLLPVSASVSERVILMPLFAGMDRDDVERACDSVEAAAIGMVTSE